MHEWLSDAVERIRKTSREGALLDKGAVPEVPEESETLEKGAGRRLLLKGVSLIEYTLLISTVSLVMVTAGPPVAEAVQGQFTKVANVISNGSTGGTGGGSDFPGGGSGGSGSDQGGTDDKTDSDGDGIPDKDDAYPNDPNNGVKPDADGDGIPDSEDAYPNDPNNGTGDRDGDGIMDKDDQYPDDPLNGKDPAVTGSIGISPTNPTVGATLTVIESGLPSDNKTYTWKNGDGQLVSSSNSYTTTDADANKTVSVEVKVDGYDGTLTASATIARKQMTGSIEITEAYVGYPVKFNYSVPSGSRAGLKWHLVKDGQDTVVSESSNYTPEAALAGKASVYLEMYDKNGQFEGSIYSVEMELTARKLSEAASLSISKAEVGASVAYSFSGPTTSGTSWKYEWSIDGAVKSSASTFTPTADMESKTLTLSISDASGNFDGKVSATAVVKPENLDNIPDSSVGGTVKYNLYRFSDLIPAGHSTLNYQVDGTIKQSSTDGKVVVVNGDTIKINKSGTYQFEMHTVAGYLDPHCSTNPATIDNSWNLDLQFTGLGKESFASGHESGRLDKHVYQSFESLSFKTINVYLNAGTTVKLNLTGTFNAANSQYSLYVNTDASFTMNISKVG